MKRLALLAIVLTVVLSGAAAWAQDGFYVIAGGGAAVGTKITRLPYTISDSGFYYLGGNLSTSGDGITVNADDVTIDLMGFSLTHTGAAGSSTGIWATGHGNVEIRNGTVRSFYNGIVAADSSPAANNYKLVNVRALKNAGTGICLYGRNHVVKDCVSSANTVGFIILHGMITGCVAGDNSFNGIGLWGPGSVIGNIAYNNGNYGFDLANYSQVVDRNSASNNGTNYHGWGAGTAWGVNSGNPPHMNYPLAY